MNMPEPHYSHVHRSLVLDVYKYERSLVKDDADYLRTLGVFHDDYRQLLTWLKGYCHISNKDFEFLVAHGFVYVGPCYWLELRQKD